MMYLEKVKQKLIAVNVKLVGCNKIEIEKVQEFANSKLPDCYIEFLTLMGKNTEADKTIPDWHFKYSGFEGDSVFYDDIFDNKEFGLLELLSEDGRDDLIELVSKNDFVFYDSQGVLQAFFKLDEGDDPPVYGYMEGYGGDNFPQIAESLSSFYKRHLEGDKTLFQELR